ncbi:murein biosynthesis integral membrane protein MurJ [Treponema phagedenis]|uniref:murein biosynthesis integral membrane protein MurJ n=1 Tax=Treponema phagedenis TaxID=162 RepID=UPI0011E85F6E|nr:murein biosynthesis integral membrane protein MurJ [Treponema phagedenis]QEK00355.1 murein biosynthesis integral membrane protein MurJ [Treponema phagedenis]
MKKISLVKSGAFLSILTFGSRILGLIREMTKSSFMGTTAMADAFTVAFMIPNLLRRLFAENSITVAFIPTFKKYLEEPDSVEQKENIKEFLSATFTLISFATSCVVIVGILFAPIISGFFKSDFSLTVLLTRIMFPYLLLISLAAFFQGILNSVKIFAPAGFTPILFNLIIIGATYALAKPLQNAALAMAIGVIIGGFVQAGFQLPFVLRQGFRFRLISLTRTLQNPGTRQVLRLIGPTIIGMAAYQVNDVISTALATAAGTGIASSLQYSLRLQELLLGVFAVSIGTVILPDMTSYAMKKNWAAFQNLLIQATKIIALITIPATVFSLLSGEHVITLIYKNRTFTDESVRLTLDAFRWHIVGLFAIALNRIIAPAFYAQNDPKSPTIAGIASFAVNILLALTLVLPMRGGGIALALTLASIANTILLFAFLRRKETIDIKSVLVSSTAFILKITFFSLIAALPLYFFGESIYRLFSGHGRLIGQGVPLFLNLCIFSAAGLVLLLITKDKTLSAIIKRIR